MSNAATSIICILASSRGVSSGRLILVMFDDVFIANGHSLPYFHEQAEKLDEL
jgi:hypothetical protein